MGTNIQKNQAIHENWIKVYTATYWNTLLKMKVNVNRVFLLLVRERHLYNISDANHIFHFN